MRFPLSFGAGLAAFAALTNDSSFRFSDPSLGRWRARANGAGVEESLWVVEASDGDWLRITKVSIAADGQPRRLNFRIKRDGQDYPVAGAEGFNSVASLRIDGQTLETVYKLDSREVRRCTTRFAADRGSSQCRCVGVNSRGRNVTSISNWILEVPR